MHSVQAQPIRDRLAAWALSVAQAAAHSDPEMPEGVIDRDADVWEALLTVADLAGGKWPELARNAAKALVADAKENPPSLGVRLLADLRTVFDDAEQLPTELILDRLCKLDESPWSVIAKGQPLSALGLSQRLRAYKVHSKNIRVPDGRVVKGYARADLQSAWERYLPASCRKSATPATSATDGAEQSASGASENEAQAATPATQSAIPATPGQPAELAVAPVADFRQDADNACEACGEPAGGPRGMLGEVNGHVLHHDCALPWEALA